MLKYSSALILFVASATSFAQSGHNKNNYRFTIDLVNVHDDKVKVDLVTPTIKDKTITYHLPKIVPGTYSEDDYGRYVEQFTAMDAKRHLLTVTKKDVDSWTIENAEKLSRITYFVNDSYDDTARKQIIFEPAGSNIQKDTNYIINNHCFLGYFDGMKKMPFEITVKHPMNFYGSTALVDVDKSNTTDKFIVESYNRIVDNPFMYDVPDTTVIRVGSTEVLISVFSPHHKISSALLASKIGPMLQAQTKYLGGKLPVNKYAFIIYLNAGRGVSGAIGALEHSFSSLYFLTESSPEQLSSFFVDAAAHEFFHIITPLSIHSEEIQNFDFNSPKMSRHLWLYEGSTEYHAQMVQEKYGLITPEELLKKLSGKITGSRTQYNDTVAFTTMSKQVLGAYARQFGNVYQKGALINMCIDIKLLQLSHGRHGIMKLINDLSAKYGKQKPFIDSLLFNDIEKLTYPEIRQFLDRYVAGPEPIPYEEFFNLVGVKYTAQAESKDSLFSTGATFRFNRASGRLRLVDSTSINLLGKKLGYRQNDEIISVNGVPVTAANAFGFTRNFGSTSVVGDDLLITVARKDADGSEKTFDLKGTMTKFPVIKFNVLEFRDNPSAEQLVLRTAWLTPNDMQKK